MRSEEEFTKALKLCRFLKAQCLVWKKVSETKEDIPTAYMLEGELQSIAALERGIRWSAGMVPDFMDLGRVASYFPNVQDEITNN